MVVTFIFEAGQIRVPEWVVDIDSFRRWVDQDDFPEQGRIWWLQGKVWVDMSREQIFTHVRVKTRITTALDNLVEERQLGLFLGDGVLVSNFAADISGVPDALFISTATLRSDRVRLIEGAKGGYVEVQGAPDMVLEVISPSSVRKDTVLLLDLYHRAGVREYWLVDTLGTVVDFKVYRRSAGAPHGSFVATVSPNSQSWHDGSVAPSTSYSYTVVASLPSIVAPLELSQRFAGRKTPRSLLRANGREWVSLYLGMAVIIAAKLRRRPNYEKRLLVRR